MRGGERVLEQILYCFPGADIYTHVADPAALSDVIRARPIQESFIARLPGARRHYQKYLGFMPRALEEFDLSGYDLVISSESGPAKGVIAPPTALHLCYCHTPMRYLYDHYPQYRATLSPPARFYFSHLCHRLRQWDYASAARVDAFVANSSFTAERIRRVWRREASVVHPPADLDAFSTGPGTAGDYYLAVSELVAYKRVDLAIEAFRGLDRRLIVVGDGETRAALEKAAPPNVEFRGRVPGETLRDLYRGARALVFPGEEDFGIVPLEAMACGTPVIAYGAGGVLDTVRDKLTGLYFDNQAPEGLRHAIAQFETMTFNSALIADHARGFSNAAFRSNFARAVDEALSVQGKPVSGAIIR
jgi:glycosyltransferase involved in cell wall biosynthesis